MKKGIKIGIALLLIAGMLASVSCSSIFANVGTTASPSAQTGTSQIVKQQGGDLFIAMPMEIASFDPLSATSEDLINLLTLVYEQPFAYDANGRLQNELVESWTVDETKTIFTFTLRDDVTFSDGMTKLTADDVVYSANRVLALTGGAAAAMPENMGGDVAEATPDAEGSGAPEESPAAQEEDAAAGTGDAAKARYTQYNSYVTGIERIDERTVRLTMNRPGNAGLHFMTFPVMSEVFAGQELPVGTGPYRVESYTQGQEMALLRNDAWWQEAPYLDKIVAKAAKGTDDELQMEQNSLIDFITTDVLYAGKYKIDGKTQVIDYMTNYYDCIVPNLINEQLKDVNVRQAISYAVDRREILSTVLLNHGVPTNMPIAPDFFAYDSRYNVSDYDSKMAREFLAQSGYRTEKDGEGNALSFTLIVTDERKSAYKKEAAKAIKKQLAEVGIEITVEELPENEYLARLAGGNYDLAYCIYYMDIVPDLAFLFDMGGSGNYGHVESAEITAAVQACALAITEEELYAAYGALQKILTERVPQIGLYYRMNSIICNESVQGIQNIRQNMIFADIAQWYNGYFAQAVVTDDPQVQPSPTPGVFTAPTEAAPQVSEQPPEETALPATATEANDAEQDVIEVQGVLS